MHNSKAAIYWDMLFEEGLLPRRPDGDAVFYKAFLANDLPRVVALLETKGLESAKAAARDKRG